MAAVRGGRWPAACEPALQNHVQECRTCSDAAALSIAFGEMRTEASGSAPAGAPGLLFWKAQLRRRNAAMENVTRPILAAEIVGFAVTLFVLALVSWKWIYASKDDFLPALQRTFDSVGSMSNWGGLLFAAVAVTLTLFGGVALYLVASKE